MTEKRVNPVTTEIIRNAFISTAEEMNESLLRSAFSPIIYESEDSAVGLFNKDVQLLGQSVGVPIFLGNLEETIKVTNRVFGKDSYKPGDVFIINDSYLAGTHLNDITVISPIFYKNELVGFAANRAHWLDIGAKVPGYPMSSSEIYQEGIRMTPTKIVDAGVERKDVIDLICLNSRFPKVARGDLNAQIAACYTGQERIIDLIERFGLDTLEEASKDIFNQSEKIERQTIREIPDGVYSSEGYLDNDGINDEPVKIKVTIRVNDDKMEIDLSGSNEKTQGATNCGLAQTISGCRLAYKSIIQPYAPVTGGSFRSLKVTVPQGSIFAAEEPVACAWYFTPLGIMIDLIIKSLSDVMPDKTAAAHYGDSMVVAFGGKKPKNKERFYEVEATVGGWGAFADSDGAKALINNVNGNYKNFPVETFESDYPIKISNYEIRKNSEGPGKYCGGQGIRRTYEFLGEDGELYLWFERSQTPAWGIFGGESGEKPEVFVNPGTENESSLLKVNKLPIEKHDVVEINTGGGGGFGDPLEREFSKVREDVIDGYISKERAKERYGVKFVDNSYEVDLKGSKKLRKRMR